ncbi:MAG: ABC transporter ATP-binding protein, partial [Chloroflexi bacterium]|nr:ABC transporter ATP-binding protein [Chloroflexota bacterium]
NGAGKTTTLRTISGLKTPSAGEIRFYGKRISGLKAHEIVKLGISHVPEGRRILAPLSVMENLEIGAYLRKSKKEAAAGFQNIYDHFPILKERRNQIAGSLSGGEQQMLAIARALLNQPKLMMMDEPSMGLSPLVVEQVGLIIKEINNRGISIILVEQNARMALNLARRAYVLEAGRCVLEGEAGAMVNDERIKHAYLGG